jgi:hypothetical protein
MRRPITLSGSMRHINVDIEIQAISASDSWLLVMRVLVNENHPAFAELHRE